MNHKIARSPRAFLTGATLFIVALALSGCQPAARTMVDVGSASADQMTLSLTFDDGPHPTFTPQVLDILARRGVKATFFVTGENAARHPQLINRMRSEGHVVSNHTWSHARLTDVSDATVADQVGRTQRTLTSQGINSKCVRPPYGANDARVENLIRVHAAGSRTMLWSIDSDDWRGHAPHIIANNVITRFHPGGVILLHDGGGNRSTTVASLDAIIDGAQARGYAFNTICK